MSEVSVLVAVYNSSKYLCRCLDSLLGQTLKDIQVVCIDDASTDDSGVILKRYSELDDRVKVVSIDVNLGQAKARNEGLKYCNGRTITMVDSDDWLSDDALEQALGVYDSDTEIDSVLFTLKYCFQGDGGRIVDYNMRTDTARWTGCEAFRLSLDWSVHGLYLTSAKFYREYPFDDSCSLFSDDNTTRLHYLHSRKVALCDGIYYYRQHPEEMTRQNTVVSFQLIEANLSMAHTLEREGVSYDLRAIFERERWINLVGIYCRYLKYSRTFSRSQRESIRRSIHRVYLSIRPEMLPFRLKFKPGFIHFKCFALFRVQVVVYYLLRIIFGRGFEK